MAIKFIKYELPISVMTYKTRLKTGLISVGTIVIDPVVLDPE